MKFSLYIAKRYLFAKSKNNFINIITLLAAVGIIVGACALFIVLSGFEGLKTYSVQFTHKVQADLEATPLQGKVWEIDSSDFLAISKIPGVKKITPVIEERVFLRFKDKNLIAQIKGVAPNFLEVVALDSLLIAGQWFTPSQNEVVIGLGISQTLSLGVRDYSDLLEVYVPKPGTGGVSITQPEANFSREQVLVSGVYQINEELDNAFVIAEAALAQQLLGWNANTYSSLYIALLPNAKDAEVKKAIARAFPNLKIKNRVEQNDALYKMLNTENLAVYLVFTLILGIALFNVVGAIIMMILDKTTHIHTLVNLGALPKEIARIFFYQGSLMTVLGGLFGTGLGVIAVWTQSAFGFIKITPSLAYPVTLTLQNILLVLATISLLGIIASGIASQRVKSVLKQTAN